MTDAPKRMTQGNPLTGEIAEYLRADLIDMDVLKRLKEKAINLRQGYLDEADPYSIAGFLRNLENDECVVELDAALSDLRAMMEKINE